MAFTQYQGFDVLEVLPDVSTAPKIGFQRSVAHLDPGIGKVTADARSYAPTIPFDFDWFMNGRSDVDTFKQFIANRRGRAVPFWFPSWTMDLTLSADVASGDTSFTIKSIDYANRLFSINGRRYLAFIFDDGTMIYRKVIGAAAGSPSETLQIDSSLGKAAPAATTMVCFLRFCRLDEDDVHAQWESTTVANAKIKMLEMPVEAP